MLKSKTSLIVIFVLLATGTSLAVADDEPTITETEKPMRHSFGDAGKEQYSISQSAIGDFTKNYSAEEAISYSEVDCSKRSNKANKSIVDHRMNVATSHQQYRDSLAYVYEPVTGNQRFRRMNNVADYLKPSKSEDIEIKLGKHREEDCLN